MTEKKLIFTMQTENELIERQSASQRTIEIIVQAPPMAIRSQPRPPLNLALVIDRSGSMSRDKLAFVQQAAIQLLDLLDERDRVAVVAYDDEVSLIAESTLLTPAARRQMKNSIQQIHPGGSTNLRDGWLTGCQQVATHQAKYQLNRALLMTDGLANVGIVEPEELNVEARGLYRRGVSTSTFGVGLGFNEHLLEGMATVGGGNFYFIEQPSQIPNIFTREFTELATVTARDVELTLEIPAGVKVNVLGELDNEMTAGKLRIFLGSLAAGQPKYVYLNLLIQPAGQEAEMILRGRVMGHGETGEIFESQAEMGFRCASPEEVRSKPAQDQLLGRAAQVILEDAVNQALKLERAGQGEKASSLLTQVLEIWRPFLSPEDQHRYDQMAGRMRQGMQEEDRKTSHYLSYQKRHSRS